MNKIDLLDIIVGTICYIAIFVGLYAVIFGIDADVTVSQVYWALVTMGGIAGLLMHRIHIRQRAFEEDSA